MTAKKKKPRSELQGFLETTRGLCAFLATALEHRPTDQAETEESDVEWPPR